MVIERQQSTYDLLRKHGVDRRSFLCCSESFIRSAHPITQDIVLDAVGLGDPPGAIHVLRGPAIERLRAHRSTTAHEGNALELLATARLLGGEPEEVIVVGIEPEHFRTGIGLSDAVSAALENAAIAASLLFQEALCA